EIRNGNPQKRENAQIASHRQIHTESVPKNTKNSL
ncbi:MAG: hypothetical protein RIQ70_1513, partial [Bacteroidota bacterium]